MHSERHFTSAKNFRAFLRSRRATIYFLAIVVGAVSGIGAIVFREMISLNNYLFFDALLPPISTNTLGYNLSVALLPALGGLIAGLIVAKFAVEAKGHGIPQVIESVAFRGGRIRYRVAAVKIISSSITIGSGGSAGREGSIAQIGATFGSLCGQATRLSEKDVELLVVCGLASGIAATFNAPLGGAIFGLEILFRRFELVEALPVLLSCVFGTAVSRVFFGNFITFPTPVYAFPQPIELLFYSAFGLFLGFLSTLWVRFYYSVEKRFGRIRSIGLSYQVAIGGLLTGFIGLPLFTLSLSKFSDRTGFGIYGVGYEGVNLLLLGDISIALAIILGLSKILCTSLTVGSGGSGGIFAPSLYMGSMFGGALGLILQQAMPGLVPDPYSYATVGAAAMFAGAAGAPLASMILIPEMSMSYNLLLPLVLSCSLSHIIARRLLHGSTIYTMPIEDRGVPLSQLTDQLSTDVLEKIQVREAMIKKLVNVSPETPVKEVSHLISTKGFGAYPVIEGEKLLGIVDYRDVLRVQSDKIGSSLVKEIMKPAETIDSDETLAAAIDQMYKRNVHRLVVLERGRGKPVGFLTHEDVLRGYEAARHGHPVFEGDPFKRVKAKDVMRREVVTFESHEYISNIHRKMAEHPSPTYLVLENGRLVGRITHRELIRIAGKLKRKLRVRDIMEPKPPVAFPDETLEEVLDKMNASNVGVIPVVDERNNDKFLGIITVTEIIRGYESEK
jgi:CIC family chloride channel protein